MIRIIFLLVLLCLLFGCASTPENTEYQNPGTANGNTARAVKTSVDYMREASAAFERSDYPAAIPLYEKTLELETREPKLDKVLWYVLVDNLAMAYGITGDLKNSRRVIEYGISKDSEYPLFHYILACTYGEEGDEANALRHLATAYKFRGNLLPGEPFPNPLTDSSFTRFSNSDTFKKRIKELELATPGSKSKQD